MTQSHRLHELFPGLLGLGVFAVALWAQPHAFVGVFYDDGIYVTLAKALAEGEGYRYIHLPGAPPGVHFPILYPATLSLLWRLWPVFPQNVTLFQLFDSAVFGVAAFFALFFQDDEFEVDSHSISSRTPHHSLSQSIDDYLKDRHNDMSDEIPDFFALTTHPAHPRRK